MYIKKIEKNLILLVCLITSSIMILFIKEACDSKVQASSLFLRDGQTKVVLITVDYISLKDFAEDEHLRYLFNQSYSALISSRQNGKATNSKVKLSIGSGKRLLTNSNAINAANSQQDASEVEQHPVVYTGLKELDNINSSSEYSSYIGYLGDKMNGLGKTACILGNSDTEIQNRDNVLIAMDRNGAVDYGDVENTLIYDESFPGGKRTDFTRLMELYKANLQKSDLTIIDTGDLARLEFYKNQLTPIQYEEFRRQSISRISEFINSITNAESSNISFMIFSVYPDAGSFKAGNRLTPILIYEKGREGGLLHSKSTRRDGIISSMDIADYIIQKMDWNEKSQLQEVSTKEPLNKMLNLNRRILNVSVMRLPVLTWYAVLDIICGLLGLFYILNMRLFKNQRLLNIIKATLLVNISAPVIFLYMAAVDIENPMAFFGLFILICYAMVLAINKTFKYTISRFAAVTLIINISLMIDLIRNSFLIKSSVLGYDPIIGARFYGVGNEFSGVYIGSSILLAGCLLQKLKNKVHKKPIIANTLLMLYFAFQIYIIGAPTKGANFGATIAAVCGYFFFLSSIFGKRINLKRLGLLALVVIIVVGVIIFMDIKDIDNSTHIGRFIRDIKENGLKVLLSTLSRKLEMNLRLIRYTIWTKVLLCIILIITIMFFKPVRLLHSIFKKYKYIAAAWLGISAASIAGLIVNDSGIVLAATAMIFTGFTILYMCLEEFQIGRSGG